MKEVIPTKALFVVGFIGLALIMALIIAQVRESPLGSAHQATSSSTPASTTPATASASKPSSTPPVSNPAGSTSAPAPTQIPPVQTQPSPVQPAAQAGISIGDDFNGLNNTQINAEMSDMYSHGVRYLRFDLDWSVVERQQGKDDWSVPDKIVAAAGAHNLIPLPILDFTPMWARLGACANTNRCEPANPEDFASFAHAAAQRYAREGVHDWEIWNEPNDSLFWQPAPDADVYSQLLQESYNAIKSVDPSATVISGGLAAVTTSNDDIPPLEFLSELYNTGASGHFDAVAFHPYSFPDLPGDTARGNPWLMMDDTNPSFMSIMAAHGDGNKKIWITEYGAPTGGPEGVSESLQAQTISDAFAQLKQSSWAGPLFIYTYQDAGTDQSTSENFYGLLRADGSQKPAYQALKDALN